MTWADTVRPYLVYEGVFNGTGTENIEQTELPYSLEAEQTILGAILIDASVLSIFWRNQTG